jgi:hypothetical protein
MEGSGFESVQINYESGSGTPVPTVQFVPKRSVPTLLHFGAVVMRKILRCILYNDHQDIDHPEMK